MSRQPLVQSQTLREVQWLICMKGHPGVGKSVLAACLARELHAALVDKDDVRDAFEGLDAFSCAAEAGLDWNALAYEVMFSMAARQLAVGLSVVIDCPLSNRALYEKACAIAVSMGARTVLVECVCSDEALWRARLEDRGQQLAGTLQRHKPCTWDDLQRLLARYKGCWRWSEDSSVDKVVIDNSTGGPQQAVQTVLIYLYQMLVHTSDK